MLGKNLGSSLAKYRAFCCFRGICPVKCSVLAGENTGLFVRKRNSGKIPGSAWILA